MSKVFVSYKRVDKDKVFPLVHRMESELGIKFWVDLEGIDGDMQFTSVIIKAINECEVFLFMYSQVHEQIVDFEYDFTVRELNFAHIRHKRIVFIDIEDTNLPDWFIFNFPQRQVTQANDSRAMDKLIKDIRKWLNLPQPNSSSNKVGRSSDTKDIEGRGAQYHSETSEAGLPHPQAIDLGLPSGTKWASCNVGATKPEEPGGYYAWGETKAKSTYNWTTYKYCVGSRDTCHNLGSDIAGTKYDVAHKKWGGNWRMPTKEQFDELFRFCLHEWTTLNGVKGYKFTSKINLNSIFLPAAGNRWDDYIGNAGSYGHYWSSTQSPSYSYLAHYLYFNSGNASWDSSRRGIGRTVRPVSRI